ncbi:MAG: mechanosensitive ion channel family protein [Alphaproteobacteria bacterium]|nr:MAG: mechanosensitive ion channel family protein [Alphaproteobacteria bacterium]
MEYPPLLLQAQKAGSALWEHLAPRLGSTAVALLVAVVVALVLRRVTYRMVQMFLRHDSRSARLRTLVPLLHHVVLVIVYVIIGLVVLSSLGIDVTPILASAGVVGVAVGFGSQTLVKDCITGLFILIEDTIAVGDVVKIAGCSGVVERLTLRTVRLRDTEGRMHIIPFSEVGIVVNMTRDFSYALLEVGVSYDTDLRSALAVMEDVANGMRNDPIFADMILEPLEIMGVDKLNDYSIQLQSRMKTRPGKQWQVRRQFNLLLRERFSRDGIELPFPTRININRAEAHAEATPSRLPADTD